MTVTSGIFESNLLTLQSDLLKFALRLTSDEDDAYDLVQETSLKALKNRDKYVTETNFKGWLFTIMRNLFVNNFRRFMKESLPSEELDSLYQASLKKDFSFEETGATYDLQEIHNAIKNLPKEYRLPFAMHVSGFKYREIAKKLDLPIGTIKSRIFFTRQKLQKDLKDFI